MTRLALSLALACLVGIPLMGCVVVDAPHEGYHDEGPPPHAPAHGYRRTHQGHDLMYDSDLGVYVVVGLSNVWFLDGSYFRLADERWELSVGANGPWRVAAISAVPARLVEKRHPHGGPPGQAKHGGKH
jgi:hypothetical protein